MSNDLVNIAYTKQVDAAEQRVLVLLCDMANDHGLCWPSLDKIAWKLSISKRTVIRAVKSLEVHRAIEIRRKHRHNNIYLLRLENLPDKTPYRNVDGDDFGAALDDLGDKTSPKTESLGVKMSPKMDKMSPKDGQNVTQLGVKMSPQSPVKSSIKSSEESPTPPNSKPRTEKQKKADQDYERKWSLYSAYCCGIGLDPDSEDASLGKDEAFRQLKPVVGKSVRRQMTFSDAPDT